MSEHLRTWKADNFRLDTWDTGRRNAMGKHILRYELCDFSPAPPEHAISTGEFQYWGFVFQAADFACSPCHAIDSDHTLASILAFLSLKPGDTDEDYFKGYSERQRAWMDWRAEELSLAAMSILPED